MVSLTVGFVFADSTNEDDLDYGTIGPSMPDSLKKDTENEERNHKIGPVLPKYLQRPSRDSSDEEDSDEIRQNNLKMIGPMMPSHLMKQRSTNSDATDRDNIIGPSIPPHLRPPKDVQQDECYDDDEDDDNLNMIGPLPPGMQEIDSFRHKGSKPMVEEAPSIREEWMVNVPEGSSVHKLGFKSVTQFSQKSSSSKPIEKKYDPKEEAITEALEEFKVGALIW